MDSSEVSDLMTPGIVCERLRQAIDNISKVVTTEYSYSEVHEDDLRECMDTLKRIEHEIGKDVDGQFSAMYDTEVM